jgi:VWFA-related protein
MLHRITPKLRSQLLQSPDVTLRYTGLVTRILGCVRPFLLLLAVSTLLMGAGTSVAQQPGPAASRPEIAPVRIDAIVTDPHGRPIVDLRPSDFELFENGVARPIQAAQLRTLPKDAGPVEPVPTDADEERAARQPGTRVFAFFLDEFHVTPGGGADRARATINEFIDQNLQPQDLAVVMKPLDNVTAIRFTRDRATLHGAVDVFAGRKGDYTPRTPFEEQYIGRAPGAVIGARRQIVTAGLRELSMRLGELQADRGVIVLVSEGFPRDANPGGRASRLPDLQGLVRASSRYHVAVYPLNPSMAGEDSSPAADRDRSTAMLQWLATETGGRTIDAATIVAGMARLKHDLETYYTLTYQPAQEDGRFHTLEVKAKRRDAVVHTASGIWTPLGSEWRSAIAAPSSLPSPISRRALRRSSLIDAWVGLVRDSDGRTQMVISWESRVRGVTAPQAVAVTARTSAGATLFDGRLGQVGSASNVPPDSARFDVSTGRVEIDMTIFNAEGKNIDTDARDFDVPDLRRQNVGPVLLAPEVVRARTLRDFENATTNPDAAPASARTFARADRLLIRAPAFDMSGALVQVTAKVLNAMGQPIRDIDALQATPRDGVAQFALPLSWLVPGEYQIELMAANANGSVKQRITFKLTS